MDTPEAFDVEVHAGDGRGLVTVRGELDMASAPTLTEAVANLAASAPTVVLDLTGVTFIDSSAIGALVSSAKDLHASGHRLQIGRRSAIVEQVLSITGLAKGTDTFDVLPEG